MSKKEFPQLINKLPVHSIHLDGTRAATALVAFEAGTRSETASENGIAHFLEHLVFKGGEDFATAREVNVAAERLGGALNAYTSHDLVAFHITVRAENLVEAVDLLTDFVARPQLREDDINRERGVVLQEIARSYDQPSRVADFLSLEASHGDTPLGRTILGPSEHIERFKREDIVAFRERCWSPLHGGAFLVGNLDLAFGSNHELPEKLTSALERFPAVTKQHTFEPARFTTQTLIKERDTNQSHLRMIWQPQLAFDDPRQRAALEMYSTLLGGPMGSRLFDLLREQRGLCYTVHAYAHAHADMPLLYVTSGLESAKCVEAFRLIREIVDALRQEGPTDEEIERARAYTIGQRVRAFESSSVVARYGAQQTIVFGSKDVDPNTSIDMLDAITAAEVKAVAQAIPTECAVACVGPHQAEDFLF